MTDPHLRPNYFVIGAAKAASSSICTHLGQHPDVFMVECKEPCFFNEDRNYFGRGWVWYESLYAGSDGCKRRGEGSNQYTMKELWPHTAERIHQAAPDAKLIYIVRDPMPRIESLWMQYRANGDRDIHQDFNRAVVERPDMLVDSTNYLQQLAPYRGRFPASQIRVVFFEDYKSDPNALMKELFDFLGTTSDHLSDPATEQPAQDSTHLNPSQGKLVYSPTLLRLRRAAWLKPVKRLIGDQTKQKIAERFFLKPMNERPNWQDATRRFVLDRIGTDCAILFDEMNKPADFWNIQPIRENAL